MIRELNLSDAEFILELVNTPGWIRFIGDRQIRDSYAAGHYIVNGPLKSYAQHSFGLYAMQMKDSSELAGLCGILKRDSLEHPDLGFALLPAFEGRGLVHEAATAILSHAQQHQNVKQVLAITLEDNVRSVSLLERLGFTYEKKILIGEEELLLFSFIINP